MPMPTEELLPPSAPAEPKPSWRGRIHLVAFLVSLPAGLALVLLSRGVSAHVAAAWFAVSLAGLFVTRATYHTGNWAPYVRSRRRRMDSSSLILTLSGSE